MSADLVELARQRLLHRDGPIDGEVGAAVDDTVAGYQFLLEQGIPPERLAIAGDSAGGALTLAALVAGRDAGLPMPAAAVCACRHSSIWRAPASR